MVTYTFCELSSLDFAFNMKMCQRLFIWTLISLTTLASNVCRVSYEPEHYLSSPCSKKNDSSVICCHSTEFIVKESLTEFGDTFSSLILYNITFNEHKLQVDALSRTVKLKQLEVLSITNSGIQNMTGNFSQMQNLKCLNLSGNDLSEWEDGAFEVLRNLEILDLSRNNLSKLPQLNTSKLQLDVSGNSLRCHDVQVLMRKMKHAVEFSNKNTTICSFVPSTYWFDFEANMTLTVLEEVSEIETQCLRSQGLNGCVCKARRYVNLHEDRSTVLYSVDCSSQQLDMLPEYLPENTISLNVSNNNISNIDAMSKQDTYKKIREFIADNNLISSITVLENTEFINNFSILSLRSNKLRTIPTYFLSNSFDRNAGSSRLYLASNKLYCDCSTAQVLKIWLLTNKQFITDYDEVLCTNFQKKVIELNQSEVCVSPRDWTDYIYYIIAGEVALLIFLISKISYDYWVFKTAGYLPWPASKLPKLPCDWVFET